ncbi:unnamed protein product [Penicillium salamii]|uniref:Zn(2)-C6 fungal-type domain-containing protein n=1 Tax=Penicillium salamii TaxID=1612424 RepID=A0A9W4IZY7_9EURO|nr:unnamed protein product [Penicillium salamii]
MSHQGPACATCREKCRKCDRTRPTCKRCASKGLVCKGYPDKFRFCGLATRGKWKNQTAPTATSSSKQDHEVQQPIETPQIPTFAPVEDSTLLEDQEQILSINFSDHAMSQDSPSDLSAVWQSPDQRSVELDDVLMLDRTELLLTHYDQEICPHQIALTADGAHNPYRKFILPLAYEQIGLLYAVLGITSFHLGTVKKDRYLRDTLAVVYRLRAIRSLADTIQAGISGNIHENERDALFATIQLLLLQDIHESGISSHGVHITGAVSICNQLKLMNNLTKDDERAVFFLGNLAWLDIIRSFASPSRLCFSQELRETISSLSKIDFEQVNGCPRKLFLLMGKILEHGKAHSAGKLDDLQFTRLLENARFQLYSWNANDGKYPDNDNRWIAVAEAFRNACILYTSRLIDMTQPAEAVIIQTSVTAILDYVAEIPADCYLLELLVMPLFIAGADALSPHARHYVIMRLDNIKAMAGVGNDLIRTLLQSVWDARANQKKHDRSNVPWMWFVCFPQISEERPS